ncbi:hypothetical protein DSO57_1014919 [Entomophthora muscae]|uniref:Uncharacterized protein n=1 Tax=Entomophthora muscae TaxID=34485 RepID=A0ACC2U4B7_9FUNG|nr:hypothetical protein DSO57_1014919 [Entomophthora muscae]
MDVGNFYREEVRPIVWLDIVLFVLAIGSIFVNVVLLSFTYNCKPIDTVLISIIACLDLLSAVCICGGSIWKWASGYAVLQDNSVWCHVNSLVGWSMTLSALNITALLSLVRYLAIVRGMQLWNQYILLLAVGIIFAITFLFGLKQHVNVPLVFPSGMYCAAVWSDDRPISLYLSIIAVVISLVPVFIIPLCYARVTAFYSQVVLHRDQEYIPKKLYRRRNFLVLFTAFYIAMILPEFLQAFISITFKLKMQPWSDATCKILVFLVTYVNPAFAFHSHDEIKTNILTLLTYLASGPS